MKSMIHRESRNGLRVVNFSFDLEEKEAILGFKTSHESPEL